MCAAVPTLCPPCAHPGLGGFTSIILTLARPQEAKIQLVRSKESIPRGKEQHGQRREWEHARVCGTPHQKAVRSGLKGSLGARPEEPCLPGQNLILIH